MMRYRNFRQPAGWCIALFALAAASACQTAPTQDQMSRTTLETAPADLQLMCANAAAAQSGTESSKVLPVSSRKVDANNFVVDLNANGKPMSCTVDANGANVMVNPA